MRKFKPYDPDETIALPSSPEAWLVPGHIVYFISEVVDELDLSEIYQSYQNQDDRGQPPYDPRMMVKLLLYSYSIGKVSSRKIERATYEEVTYRVLSSNQHPDHDSIAEFRKRHLKALGGLFLQVLRLCQEAGLVKLGYIALDGTKLKANASKHKAMSYGRMEETEKKLKEEIEQIQEQIEKEIERLLEEARKADDEEEKGAGVGKREEQLPEELHRRESRLKKIQEAKAALEEEARAKAKEKAKEQQEKIKERQRREEETGKKSGGRQPQVINVQEAKPEAKAQRNFTDPESRIMPVEGGKSFVQGYNAQAAVDKHRQIIIATGVTQETNDKEQLVKMMGKVKENMGSLPDEAAADSGYFSAAQVSHPSLAGVELYVAVDRQKHHQKDFLEGLIPPTTATQTTATQTTATQTTATQTTATQTTTAETAGTGTPQESDEEGSAAVITKMREKLKEAAGRAAYGLRKSIVEPVFGQIKGARGIERFSFRGMEKVTAEWDLICLSHNLLKLYRYGRGWQAS
jgi:transposase